MIFPRLFAATAFIVGSLTSCYAESIDFAAIAASAASSEVAPRLDPSDRVVAQHELRLARQRMDLVASTVASTKFVNRTGIDNESSRLPREATEFLNTVSKFLKIGIDGFPVIVQHDKEISALVQRGAAVALSLFTMNFTYAALAIVQLVPDTINFVDVVAPELGKMLRQAAPIAADLLEKGLHLPITAIRHVKSKVDQYLCRVNRTSKRKMGPFRLQYCLKRGLIPLEMATAVRSSALLNNGTTPMPNITTAPPNADNNNNTTTTTKRHEL